MMTYADNPRAVVGDNRAPDYAQRVTEELRAQYRETERQVQGLLDEAAVAPTITDDDTMGVVARLIKKIKDEAKRLVALHDAEKQPHLRAGQAVDQFFFALQDKLAKRNRMGRPGIADELQQELDDYNQRKLAAERERRRQEEERLRREEERRLREAEEAKRRAERARKDIEEKQAVASAAQAEADRAAIAAEDARIAMLAKPADMIRTRVDEGPMVTMGTESYAVIEDYAALDKEQLWPFITRSALDAALKGWARTTNYSQPMAGARVGRRPKTVVR